MNSTTNNTHQGVQPLVADDANSADIKSDEELHGASEDDCPLHQAEEATNHSTISGDGPEILRIIQYPSSLYNKFEKSCFWHFVPTFFFDQGGPNPCLCIWLKQ